MLVLQQLIGEYKVRECSKASSDTCTIGQCRESTCHDDNMDCSGEQYHKQGGSIKWPAYQPAIEEEKGAPNQSKGNSQGQFFFSWGRSAQ